MGCEPCLFRGARGGGPPDKLGRGLEELAEGSGKTNLFICCFFVVKNDIWTQTLGQLERQLPQRKSSQDRLDCCFLIFIAWLFRSQPS